jgi:Fe-S-cluster containining protein
VDASAFTSRTGCQISLVPDSTGEGYHCPAFDPGTSHCRIYEQRPLDCQLYPLALMWNAQHDDVLLGWDTACPFMREQVPASIRSHADRVMTWLKRPEIVNQLAEHPRLIGRFQDDVVVMASLPMIGQTIAARWSDRPIHRFTIDDLPRLTEALDRSGLREAESLAAYSAPYHYLCNTLLTYWWMDIQGAFCLFVQSPDSWFMPLPPLTSGPIADPLAKGFELMRRWNGDSPVTRVENISASLASVAQELGYRLTPKDPDYLYRAADLVSLAGDRYKSQRALCNRIGRMAVAITPYELRDRADCRRLLQAWQQQKQADELNAFGRLLLDDAASAHEVVWSRAADLQLTGTVLRVAGRIRAYTFGYWLTDRTWCVLAEVADRSIPGLAQYLFRDTCRRALAKGAEFINTMDDAGLPGLRQSKQAYHPFRQIQNFMFSEEGRL